MRGLIIIVTANDGMMGTAMSALAQDIIQAVHNRSDAQVQHVMIRDDTESFNWSRKQNG